MRAHLRGYLHIGKWPSKCSLLKTKERLMRSLYMQTKRLETTLNLRKPNIFLCDCDAAACQRHRNNMVNNITIEYCMLLLRAIAGSYGNKTFYLTGEMLSIFQLCHIP